MMRMLFCVAGLLAAALPSFAAPAAKPLPTNFVQTISFQLMAVGPGTSKTTATGYSQTVSNKTLVTKDAIQALGAVAGIKFSANAKLVCVTPITEYYTNAQHQALGFLGATPSFQIRDGTNIIDVTAFFTIATLNTNSIQSVSRTSGYLYHAFTNYRVRSITVSNPALSFTGQGFVESPLVAVTVKPGVIVLGNNDNWTSFTGVGTEGPLNGILQGTIKATYSKLE